MNSFQTHILTNISRVIKRSIDEKTTEKTTINDIATKLIETVCLL